MRSTLAISPCPNDTFMFHGIISGAIQPKAVEYDLVFADIDELNRGVAEERYDFCKVSSVAALANSTNYQLCSVGAAIGFGVGPLLLSSQRNPNIDFSQRVLAPGSSTTAYALLRYFYPRFLNVNQVLFSEIMPTLQRGAAEYGVVIHEGRFTYQSFGLECVADLGALWEESFALPLPLGCVVAHRRISAEAKQEFEDTLRASIDYGYSHRDEAFITMRHHARELSSQALWAHVDLYVNQWSLNLDSLGAAAFDALKSISSSR